MITYIKTYQYFNKGDFHLRKLTNEERRVIGYATQHIESDVDLGTIVNDIVDVSPRKYVKPNIEGDDLLNPVFGSALFGEPYGGYVNVSHGDTITINNANKPGVDVYEFVTDELGTVSSPTNIPVNVGDLLEKASTTLTIDTMLTPDAGESLTIGDITYTFSTDEEAIEDGVVYIGESLLELQENLVLEINKHPLVEITNFVNNVATIKAKHSGYSGNSISVSETMSAVTNTFAASALTGGEMKELTSLGAICNALIVAIEDHDTQDVVLDCTLPDIGSDPVSVLQFISRYTGPCDIVVTSNIPDDRPDKLSSTLSDLNTLVLSDGFIGEIGSPGAILLAKDCMYVCPSGSYAPEDYVKLRGDDPFNVIETDDSFNVRLMRWHTIAYDKKVSDAPIPIG